MAALSKPSSPPFNSLVLDSFPTLLPLTMNLHSHITPSSSSSNYTIKHSSKSRTPRDHSVLSSYRLSPGGHYFSDDDHDNAEEAACSGSRFEEAVAVFNSGDYYKCHDILEDLWNDAEEPRRTLFHGILQCSVGFYHLFKQNHKGAMMELGEGLCKLRKMSFEGGPFLQFEQEISAVLEFIYQTQLELAACSDDLCVAIDQSERSYQLLGGYGAGQHLYRLETDSNGTMSVTFYSGRSYATEEDQVSIQIYVTNTCKHAGGDSQSLILAGDKVKNLDHTRFSAEVNRGAEISVRRK